MQDRLIRFPGALKTVRGRAERGSSRCRTASDQRAGFSTTCRSGGWGYHAVALEETVTDHPA